MKRLLMISFPFPPNAMAGAVRSERFARYLPELGWSVDVITIKPRPDLFQDKTRLQDIGNDVTVHLASYLDLWLWLRDKRPRNILLRAARTIFMRIFSFPDNALFWVPFAVQKGLTICSQKSVDAIYTTSPPHSSHLAGLVLSRLTKKPWIADFRDPWTLNAFRNKGMVEGFLLNMERIMEKAVLERASTVLANTKANRKNVLMAFPFLKSNKVVHLPNSWEEFPTNTCNVGKNRIFTIVHAGNFYSLFRPYALLYALAAWRDGKCPTDIPPLKKNIRIILLGSRDSETKRVIHDLGIGGIVQVKPWVALEDARKGMCQADMLWASLGTGQKSSTYVPSKLFEYIAAKRPIIGFFPEGEATSLIRETGTGVVFTNDDPNAVIKFLHEIMSTKEKRLSFWYNPNTDAIKSYYIKTIVSRLSQLLDKMIEKH